MNFSNFREKFICKHLDSPGCVEIYHFGCKLLAHTNLITDHLRSYRVSDQGQHNLRHCLLLLINLLF